MSLTRRLFLRTGAAAGIAVVAPATATMAGSTLAADGVANHGLSPETAKLYSASRRSRRAVKEYGPIHTEADDAHFDWQVRHPQRPEHPKMTDAEMEEYGELKVRELQNGIQPASYRARLQQYWADLAAFEEASESAPRDERWEEIDATWRALIDAENLAAMRLFQSPARNIHDMAIKVTVGERIGLTDQAFEALSKDLRRMARAARKGGAS